MGFSKYDFFFLKKKNFWSLNSFFFFFSAKLLTKEGSTSLFPENT